MSKSSLIFALACLACPLQASVAADFKPEVIRAGKQATALAVAPSGAGVSCAFCIDRSGYFLTIGGLASPANESQLKLLLRAGEVGQQEVTAKVVKQDEANRIDVVHAPGELDLPALKLAPRAELTETQQLAVFGFPGDTARRPRGSAMPSVTVNVVRITRLEKSAGKLELIHIDGDAAKGLAGGPVLNEAGEVIGLLRRESSGSVHVLPIAKVAPLLTRPELRFNPPPVAYEKRFEPQRFSIGVVRLQTASEDLEVKLKLGEESVQREIDCQRQKDGSYAAEVAPLVGKSDDALLVEIAFRDGLVRGRIEDGPLKAGKAGKRWSDLARVERRDERWWVRGQNGAEEIVDKNALKKLSVAVGGEMIEFPAQQMVSINVLDRDEPLAVPYEIAAIADGKTIASLRGFLPIAARPGGFQTLSENQPWPAFLDEPPVKPGKEALTGLNRHFVRTPRGDFLRKNFQFDLVFTISKSDHILLVGLGQLSTSQQGGEPEQSLMLRIHSQQLANGDVILSNRSPLVGERIGRLPPGTHRATIRKLGDKVVYSIDVDNNGPSPEDMEHTISNLREFAPYLDHTNAYLFFGGSGTFQQVRLNQTVPAGK